MTQLINLFVATPRLFLYAAVPITLDYGIFRIASGKMWKYGGSTVAGLGAVAVLSRYSPHTRVISLIYFAYKALLAWSNIPWGASKPGPSISTTPISMDEMKNSWLAALRHSGSIHLKDKFAELHLGLRFEYPHDWTSWKDLNAFAENPTMFPAAREKWQKNWGKALELIQEAAKKFESLRDDLLLKFDSAPSEEEKHQQIAQFFLQFLQKDNSLRNTKFSSYSDLYRNRNLPQNLLGYYRFIRSMSYNVGYKNSTGGSCTETYTPPIDYNEYYAFSKEGTPQYQIRQIYNQEIEKWLPIMEYLPPDSPYRAWIQRDEMNVQFNLNPPPLPWD